MIILAPWEACCLAVNQIGGEGQPDGSEVKIGNIAKSTIEDRKNLTFKKNEVAKGVSNMGYTAITLVKKILRMQKLKSKVHSW